MGDKISNSSKDVNVRVSTSGIEREISLLRGSVEKLCDILANLKISGGLVSAENVNALESKDRDHGSDQAKNESVDRYILSDPFDFDVGNVGGVGQDVQKD